MWKTEKKVRVFVEKQQMILPHDRLIAGISGGADSVYLFHLLVRWQKTCDFMLEVVHVNHGLRGMEADEDERFVEKLCKENQIPFHSVHGDVKTLAKEQGVSTEEAGRLLRYQAFEKLCGNRAHSKIVLAHHQDDLAETMLHHLARGTGLQGLCSLKPVSGNRIRPLLCLTREEIEQELQRQAYLWRTDRTNQEDIYTRNKIRHHVLDYMKREINARTVSHMAHTARELEETELLLEQWTQKLTDRMVCRKDGKTDIAEALSGEPELLQRRVFLQEIRILSGSGKDLTRIHAADVLGLWRRQVGKQIILPNGLRAVRTYEGIRMERPVFNQEEETGVCISIEPPMTAALENFILQCDVFENKMEIIEEKKYTKWLDYDKIKTCLQLRHRRPGDRICVNAKGQTRKLKDYFIDQKIPREERDSLWLLADGSRILWVIGYRISEDCKITEDTKTVISIQIRGGNIHERKDQCND